MSIVRHVVVSDTNTCSYILLLLVFQIITGVYLSVLVFCLVLLLCLVYMYVSLLGFLSSVVVVSGICVCVHASCDGDKRKANILLLAALIIYFFNANQEEI